MALTPQGAVRYASPLKPAATPDAGPHVQRFASCVAAPRKSHRGVHSFFGASTIAANDGLFSSGSAFSWGSMARELLQLEECLWTFVDVPNIVPTNNFGEQCIRHAVMYRKTSFGTQGPEGSRFIERIFTAVTTLNHLGHGVDGRWRRQGISLVPVGVGSYQGSRPAT